MAQPSQCEALAKLALPSSEIISAQWIAAGPMPTSPASSGAAAAGRAAQPPTMLPAHCRVAIVMRPSTDSEIEAEVWLPAEWNGKFQAVGNGGWAGTINYRAMAGALQGGYATASTDTGHKSGNGAFAIGHPEKLIDFGYRAIGACRTAFARNWQRESNDSCEAFRGGRPSRRVSGVDKHCTDLARSIMHGPRSRSAKRPDSELLAPKKAIA